MYKTDKKPTQNMVMRQRTLLCTPWSNQREYAILGVGNQGAAHRVVSTMVGKHRILLLERIRFPGGKRRRNSPKVVVEKAGGALWISSVTRKAILTVASHSPSSGFLSIYLDPNFLLTNTLRVIPGFQSCCGWYRCSRPKVICT